MKRNLKKWIVMLLGSINILILMTITNNSFITDLILLMIFLMNSYLIYKYDHKYINVGADDYE